MRITLFSPHTLAGARRITTLARILAQKGHIISIVLPSLDRRTGFCEERTEIEGVRLVRPHQFRSKNLEITMLPYMFSSSLSGISLKSDILHILKPLPFSCTGYIVKLFRGTPVIQDVVDLDHKVMIMENHPRIKIFIIKWFERVIPRLANHVITCSSFLRTMYINLGIDEDKVTWIPNGVNVEEFNVKPCWPIKEQYGLRDKVIVYVGSLNNPVQVRPLIDLMILIAEERKDTSCLMIGDGRAKPYLELLTHKQGLDDYVVFTGFVPHTKIPNFLSVCDIGFSCFPKTDYIAAASNLKLFEYMAAGVLPIVNSVGDSPFYVNFGKAGVIAEPNDERLFDVINELLENRRKRKNLQNKAREYVKDHFDWEILAGKILEVYNKVR